MKNSYPPPYVRTGSPMLSRWQSVVFEWVSNSISASNPGISQDELHRACLDHPMVLGTNDHVWRMEKGLTPVSKEEADTALTSSEAGNHAYVQSFLSNAYFEKVANTVADTSTKTVDEEPSRYFPDTNANVDAWIECARLWSLYGKGDFSDYVDWQTQKPPVNISSFQVFTIPDDCKILILGDFGTQLADAKIMLRSILTDPNVKPDIIIHLGDIYYSGTNSQSKDFAKMFNEAFEDTGVKVPVFLIPGNHEYYANGEGFFKYVLPLNRTNGFANYNQTASYFCLRTQSGGYQFLGMDTGVNSLHYHYRWDLMKAYSPWLWFSEAAWHQDKMKNFSGETVLLSHHQLFSVSAEINSGKDVVYKNGSDKAKLQYFNENLWQVFNPYFANVAAWFWAHEHILGIYTDGQYGLSKGRLIGNSGYEEWDLQPKEGYVIASPTNTYSSNPPIMLGTTEITYKGNTSRFFNHGFALLTLSGGKPIETSYWEFPVADPKAVVPKFTPGGPVPPGVPKSSRIAFKESLDVPPLSPVAGSVTASSAIVKWASTARCVKFEVYYKISTGDAWTKLDTTIKYGGDMELSLAGLLPSTTYQFYVKTVFTNNVESKSNVGSFTTLA